MTNVNRNKLVFPTDRYGVTSQLKKVFGETIQNLKGDAEKYKLFKEVVSIFMQHAELKYAEQVKEKQSKINALDETTELTPEIPSEQVKVKLPKKGK